MSEQKHLVLVSDAWLPQTNGVVTLLLQLIKQLETLGIRATVIHPGEFRVIQLPGYSEVGIVCNPWQLGKKLVSLRPDYIHIPAEGPLGLAARSFCKKHGLPYTTALHTKLPDYAKALYGIPISLGNAYLRWFHKFANARIVQSEGHSRDLQQIGLTELSVVGGGVDLDVFHPQELLPRQRPVLLFVGRVSKEKQVEQFLELNLDAEKIVVGDGPHRATLERQFPNAIFKGYLRGEPLVTEYAQADCFVFPSTTDTFGLVLVEAMACGTPVAAYPVTGPKDLVKEGINGALSHSLEDAVVRALKVDRQGCQASVQEYGWQNAALKFSNVLRESQIDSFPQRAT
ncbi:MAG: glycosyltransferase family 1 protein [Gammaproteobacteria bacterium]|nr:glycosyltransferase family 1 protein [Gammaproteobacteria bacterium]